MSAAKAVSISTQSPEDRYPPEGTYKSIAGSGSSGMPGLLCPQVTTLPSSWGTLWLRQEAASSSPVPVLHHQEVTASCTSWHYWGCKTYHLGSNIHIDWSQGFWQNFSWRVGAGNW